MIKVVLRDDTISFKCYVKRKIAQAGPALVWMLSPVRESMTGDLVGNAFAWDEVGGGEHPALRTFASCRAQGCPTCPVLCHLKSGDCVGGIGA